MVCTLCAEIHRMISSVKPTMHSWNEPNLFIMYYSLHILQYLLSLFVKNFCDCLMRKSILVSLSNIFWQILLLYQPPKACWVVIVPSLFSKNIRVSLVLFFIQCLIKLNSKTVYAWGVLFRKSFPKKFISIDMEIFRFSVRSLTIMITYIINICFIQLVHFFFF